MSLNEDRLISRAMRMGWNIPQELRQTCIDRMGQIIQRSTNERAVASAVQAVVAMDRVSLAAEKLDLEERKLALQTDPDPTTGADYVIDLSPPEPEPETPDPQTQDPETPDPVTPETPPA